MTSGAGGNTNARLVQVHENVLTVDVFKRDVGRVRQTFRTIRNAVQTRVGNVCEDLVFESIAQPLDAVVTAVVMCKLASRTESDDVGNGGRSGAATLLLPTAHKK